jgi:hypothetical protein
MGNAYGFKRDQGLSSLYQWGGSWLELLKKGVVVLKEKYDALTEPIHKKITLMIMSKKARDSEVCPVCGGVGFKLEQKNVFVCKNRNCKTRGRMIDRLMLFSLMVSLPEMIDFKLEHFALRWGVGEKISLFMKRQKIKWEFKKELRVYKKSLKLEKG